LREHGAAVGPLEQTASLERLEVPANGHLGNTEELGERRDADHLALPQELPDPPVPFSRKRLFHALALPLLAREAGSAMTEPERVCPQSIVSASGAG
jgi:hypothetical protein